MPDQLTTFKITYILDRIAASTTTTDDAVQIARLLWRESVSHVAQYAAGAWLTKNGEDSYVVQTRPGYPRAPDPGPRNPRRESSLARRNGRSRRRGLWHRRQHPDKPADALRPQPAGDAGAADPTAGAADGAAGHDRQPTSRILAPATILESATFAALLPYTTPAPDAARREVDL